MRYTQKPPSDRQYFSSTTIDFPSQIYALLQNAAIKTCVFIYIFFKAFSPTLTNFSTSLL